MCPDPSSRSDPASPPAGRKRGSTTGDGNRLLKWLGDNVGKTVVTTLVGLAVVGGVAVLRGKDASIPEQLERVRADAAAQGFFIKTQRKLRLRAAATSDLFVLGSERRIADEVRLYDEIDGKLRLALALPFDPQIVDLDPGLDLLSFEVLASPDIGGDGRRELIGAYDYEDYLDSVQFPVAVAWDEVRRRYLFSPLLTSRPPVDLSYVDDTVRPAYTSGLTLKAPDGRQVRAWGARSVALLADDVLVTGLPGNRSVPTPRVMQINGWSLGFRDARPDVTALCVQGPSTARYGYLEVLRPGASEPRAIADAWRRVERQDRLARSGGKLRVAIGAVIGGECFLGE